ncbi:hypothetical protein A1D22_05995 [Pasteurellaceae bacterium LFhippo2]|nr:hypothetical protein [Pasteurellaceae bacterium LFhippo2]
MDNLFLLLNTIFKRVLFGDFTMFLVFLFIGFAFKPAEWDLYLLNKTPAFFPDWFTLSTFGSLVFACVSTMIWIILCNFLKWLGIKLDNYFYPRIRRMRSFAAWEKVCATLSQDEFDIIETLMRANGTNVQFNSNNAVLKLTAKGVIMLTRVDSIQNKYYILNPTFRAFMQDQMLKVDKAL